jgi:hypothetical protein
MKLLGSHTTTEGTNRRQEQEILMTLKRDSFASLGKIQGKYVKVCWTGNRLVRSPAYQGGGCWMPGVSGSCALKRAVRADLRSPMENPDLLSCDRSFLPPFKEQMKGFHDLLKQKPSYPFTLMGRSSVPIAFLMMRSCIWVSLRRRRCGVAPADTVAARAFNAELLCTAADNCDGVRGRLKRGLRR